jgi:hypothetical protein
VFNQFITVTREVVSVFVRFFRAPLPKHGSFQQEQNWMGVTLTGWNGSNVGYGNWILFSTPSYNPENNASLRYHNVQLMTLKLNLLLDLKIFDEITLPVMGLNDAIFFVTAAIEVYRSK